MAGLFDAIWNDPSGQALTALGAGLLGVRRGNEGRAIYGALDAYNQAQQEQRRNKLTDAQLQMTAMQLQQLADAQKDNNVLRAIYSDPSKFMRSPQAAFPPNEMDPEGSPAAPPVFDQRLLAESLLKSGTLSGAKEGIGMLTKDNTPIAIGEGGMLVTRDGRPIASNPKQTDQWVVIGKLPNGQPIQRNLRTGETKAIGAVGTTVNTNIVQERAEDKVVGEEFGKLYVSTQQAGLGANSKIAKLDRLSALLQGVETGRLTPATTELAAYAKEFGIEIDPKLDVKQAANALTNAMALEMRNPQGGAGMPGALSDKDREFLMKTVPSLANTPGGNKQIIETQKRLARRDVEIAKLARDYRAKKGRIDEGFFQELQSYSDAHPLFDDMASAAQTGGAPVMRFDRNGNQIK